MKTDYICIMKRTDLYNRGRSNVTERSLGVQRGIIADVKFM